MPRVKTECHSLSQESFLTRRQSKLFGVCCRIDTQTCWNSAFLDLAEIVMSTIGVVTESKWVGLTLFLC